MSNFDELLKTLKSKSITQTVFGDEIEEDFEREEVLAIWEACKPEAVAFSIDMDERRWYQTSITVYEIEGRYLGIRMVDNIYSEQSSMDDLCSSYHFFEMEQVPSYAYKVKK